MFNGFSELILIFILFIVLVKPSEYKDVFRTLGRLFRQVREFVDSISKNLDIK
jgi:Sec-independent protein translocase protein TatA